MNTSIENRVAYNLRSRKIGKRCTGQTSYHRSKKTPMVEDDGQKLVTEETPMVEDEGEKPVAEKAVEINHFPPPSSFNYPGKELSYEEKLALAEHCCRNRYLANLKMSGEAEMNACHEEEWKSWADKALEHYNSKQNAKFRLVKVTAVVSNASLPRKKVHINFKAKSDDDASSKLFFSEMDVPWNSEQGLEILMNGCCILEQVDSGDPNARPCSTCWYPGCTLVHPTPRYGHRCASGDPFTDLESRF